MGFIIPIVAGILFFGTGDRARAAEPHDGVPSLGKTAHRAVIGSAKATAEALIAGLESEIYEEREEAMSRLIERVRGGNATALEALRGALVARRVGSTPLTAEGTRRIQELLEPGRNSSGWGEVLRALQERYASAPQNREAAAIARDLFGRLRQGCGGGMTERLQRFLAAHHAMRRGFALRRYRPDDENRARQEEGLPALEDAIARSFTACLDAVGLRPVTSVVRDTDAWGEPYLTLTAIVRAPNGTHFRLGFNSGHFVEVEPVERHGNGWRNRPIRLSLVDPIPAPIRRWFEPAPGAPESAQTLELPSPVLSASPADAGGAMRLHATTPAGGGVLGQVLEGYRNLAPHVMPFIESHLAYLPEADRRRLEGIPVRE